MTEQERNEKLAKIKKLLALAGSDPDSPEAKSAAAMAGQLMAKYNIAIHDQEVSDGTEGIIERIEKNYISGNMKWEMSLHAMIGTTFPVTIIRRGERLTVMRYGKPTQTVRYEWAFLGQAHEVDIAVWFFNFLRLNISKRADKLHPSKRESYATGFLVALLPRLEELHRSQTAAVPEDKKALVLATEQLTLDEVAKRYPKAAKKPVDALDAKHKDAFQQGKRDGERQALSTPLASNGDSATPQMVNGKIALSN